MDIISVIGVSVALAMDAFSVSISAGVIIKNPNFKHYFRLAFHFGLFQFIMPIIGYFAGAHIESCMKGYAHWIAFGLLSFIGFKMTRESLTEKKNLLESRDPSRGYRLVLLAVATSIDALAVGLSIGVLKGPILLPSIIIGITCSIFSIIGVAIGKKASSIIGRRGEAFGGVILIIIGIKILVEYIM